MEGFYRNEVKFQDNQNIYELPDLWEDVSQIGTGYAQAREFYKKFINQITSDLNNYYGTRYGSRFFQILYGDSILFILAQVFDKYYKLSIAQERFGDGLVTHVLHEDDYQYPKNRNQLAGLLDDHGWNYQLSSEVARFLGISSKSNKNIFDPVIKNKSFKKSLKKNILSFVTSKCNSVLNLFGLGKTILSVERSKGIWKVLIKSRFKISYFLPYLAIDEYKTSQIKFSYISENKYEELCLKVLSSCFHVFEKDFFNETMEKVRKLARFKGQNTFFDSSIFYGDSYIRFFVAHLSQSNKIFFHQHGGGYGAEGILQQEDYERDIADVFFTWGWSEDRKCIPLSPDIDLRFYYSAVTSSKRVLFCLDRQYRYFYKFHYTFCGTRFLRDYVEESLAFVDACKKESDLTVRLRPRGSFGWDLSPYFNFKGYKLSSPSTSFLEEIKQSDVLVSNHLSGTTFLEAMMHGWPSIIFFPKTIVLPRESFKPMLDRLEEVGIYHTNALSAAKFIERTNINQWWKSSETQAVVSEFKTKYARCVEEGWVTEWASTLSEIRA